MPSSVSPSRTSVQLEQVFTPAQIYQLALDRTPITDNYSFTATKPLGQRFPVHDYRVGHADR